MKYQSLFARKNKKTTMSLSSAEFLQRIVRVYASSLLLVGSLSEEIQNVLGLKSSFFNDYLSKRSMSIFFTGERFQLYFKPLYRPTNVLK